MTTALLSMAALASLWLLGASTLALLDARADGAAGIAADYVSGVVLLAFVGMTGIALGWGVGLAPVYLLLVGTTLGCVVTGAWRRLPRPSVASIGLPRDAIASAVLGSATLMTLAVLAAATRDRLWWDGWSIWAFKARVLFLEGTLPARFLDPHGIYVTANLDYPLAVPLLDWWVYRHIGMVAPAAASFVGAVWFAILPALAWGTLRRVTGARVAALAALGLAAFWPISFYAGGGTADVVIAVALLGSVIEITGAFDTRARAHFVRGAAYLALAAVTKNEGIALALVALTISICGLVLTGERRVGRLAWLAAPLIAVGPWLVFVRSLAIGSPALSDAAGGGADAAVGDRLTMFVTGLRVLFTTTPWLAAAALVVVGIWAFARARSARLVPGWSVLAIFFVLLAIVYIRSSADMLWLLTTSAPRVFGALVPGLVYMALLAIFQPHHAGPKPETRPAIDDLAV